MPAKRVIVVDANRGQQEMAQEFRRQEANILGPEKENRGEEEGLNGTLLRHC